MEYHAGKHLEVFHIFTFFAKGTLSRSMKVLCRWKDGIFWKITRKKNTI